MRNFSTVFVRFVAEINFWIYCRSIKENFKYMCELEKQLYAKCGQKKENVYFVNYNV